MAVLSGVLDELMDTHVIDAGDLALAVLGRHVGPLRAAGPPAVGPRRRAARAARGRPGAHRRARNHGVSGPPVLILTTMGVPPVDLQALVLAHAPTSEREQAAQARFLSA